MSFDKEPIPESGSPPQTSPGRRRSSIADLFASRPNPDSSAPGPGMSKASGSSMATALSQAQDQSNKRRLSITTLGLTATQPSAPQTMPFGNLRRGSSSYETPRRKSLDSDSAIDDSDTLPPISSPTSSDGSGRANGGMSPLGRRFSFGAKAYGDSRSSFGGSAAVSPPSLTDSASRGSMSTSAPGPSLPPGMKGRAEGFNWTDSLRNRAQRSSTITEPAGGTLPFPALHGRNKSAAPAPQAPAPAPPNAKPVSKAPDHFQERILKGDFYMD